MDPCLSLIAFLPLFERSGFAERVTRRARTKSRSFGQRARQATSAPRPARALEKQHKCIKRVPPNSSAFLPLFGRSGLAERPSASAGDQEGAASRSFGQPDVSLPAEPDTQRERLRRRTARVPGT